MKKITDKELVKMTDKLDFPNLTHSIWREQLSIGKTTLYFAISSQLKKNLVNQFLWAAFGLFEMLNFEKYVRSYLLR